MIDGADDKKNWWEGQDVAGAGILTAGSFLSQYLAQRAADERAKREGIAQTNAQHGAMEQNQYGQLMDAYKAALLR